MAAGRAPPDQDSPTTPLAWPTSHSADFPDRTLIFILSAWRRRYAQGPSKTRTCNQIARGCRRPACRAFQLLGEPISLHSQIAATTASAVSSSAQSIKNLICSLANRMLEVARIRKQCCRQPEETDTASHRAQCPGGDLHEHQHQADSSGRAHEAPVARAPPNVASLCRGFAGWPFPPPSRALWGAVSWLANRCSQKHKPTPGNLVGWALASPAATIYTGLGRVPTCSPLQLGLGPHQLLRGAHGGGASGYWATSSDRIPGQLASACATSSTGCASQSCSSPARPENR
jgi:hypothetical protein